MRSMPFGSLPRMAPADSAAIAGCPRREKPISRPDDASTRSANFLREELESRLRNGPSRSASSCNWLAESDPTDDVTALWPADRPLVELGRLEVTGISPTSAADERRLVFDPTNLTDGIDLSAIRFCCARSAAYSISYDHRSKGA